MSGHDTLETDSGLTRSGTFLRFQDPSKPVYDRGADGKSFIPTIYLDPARLSILNPDRAGQVRKQLEEQSPGSSERFSKKELEIFFSASTSQGPFAENTLVRGRDGEQMCIINRPYEDLKRKESLIEAFGVAGDPDTPEASSEKPGIDPRHFKPLPGEDADYERLMGEHEGEHCNQNKHTNDLELLERETLSDRSALATLRAEGKHEVAQAWVDMRMMTAARGDALHATSVFLDEKVPFQGVPQEALDAAKSFKFHMSDVVAERSGITLDEANYLCNNNPRAYTKIVEEALKEGVYDNGNPYIKKYIEGYVGAVDRLTVADTSPLERPKPEPEVELSEKADDPEAGPTEESWLDEEAPETVIGDDAKALFSRLMNKDNAATLGSLHPQADEPAPQSPTPKNPNLGI